MAVTGDQLVTLALQDAKVPGYVSQAFLTLNIILSDLCQTYDFDVARGLYSFPFVTGLGSGPIPLPADYLRADIDDVYFVISGVRYVMASVDLAQFDNLVQQAGLAAQPSIYATDLSLQNSAVPVMYVWPPPAGAYVVTMRYRRQMPDYVQGSGLPIWFPNLTYLRRRLAGEMMTISDDPRMSAFLGDGAEGAQGILSRYLKLKDDSSARTAKVTLDRRSFGRGGSGLRVTKRTGF